MNERDHVNFNTSRRDKYFYPFKYENSHFYTKKSSSIK